MSTIPLFSPSIFYATHMPFYLKQGDRGIWYFSARRAQEDSWSIYSMEEGQAPTRHNTGLDEDWVECGPVAYANNLEKVVSFNAGPPGGPYHLYRQSLGGPVEVESSCVGFYTPDSMVHGGWEGGLGVIHRGVGHLLLMGMGASVYRVCPDISNPDGIIITCTIDDKQYVLIYNMVMRTAEQVVGRDDYLYKACRIDSTRWAYAKKHAGDFEDREVMITDDVDIRPYDGALNTKSAAVYPENYSTRLVQAMNLIRSTMENIYASGRATKDDKLALSGEFATAERCFNILQQAGPLKMLNRIERELQERDYIPTKFHIAYIPTLCLIAKGCSNPFGRFH